MLAKLPPRTVGLIPNSISIDLCCAQKNIYVQYFGALIHPRIPIRGHDVFFIQLVASCGNIYLDPLPDYILIYSQRGPRDGAGYCEQTELRRGVDSILSSAAFIVLYELIYCILSDFDSTQGQDMCQCYQSTHT